MAGKSRPKTAIVIGAGAGGVATAARLASAGYSVTVYERNSYTGGRCSLIEQEGYRFDRGPSLLLLPELFRQTFTDLGTSLEAEGVSLLRCSPNYLLHFSDGSHMTLSTDTAQMKAEIERYEGPAGFARYLTFLKEAHVHYTLSVQHVLLRPFSSLFAMLRPSFLAHTLALHPFESLYSRASRYFRTERLRRALTFGSMYMGMSPFEAPATYSLLQYTELAEGIWYPKGGFHAVIAALVQVAQRKGVVFRLSTAVQSVNVDPRTKRATGVTLADGTAHAADVVVINADLVTAYSTLLPQADSAVTAYAAKLQTRRTSCSSISFYWSLSASTAGALAAHNVFLAEHYRASFDQIFRDNHVPDEPSFYIHSPCRVDASAAPDGTDALAVLVPCGHLAPGVAPEAEREKWEGLARLVRAKVLHTVRQRTGVDLGPLIVHEQVNTPATWAESLALDRGAILGLAHDFFSVLAFRPSTKARGVKRGCWFVGASTHPGTGVPIVLAGAKVVVDEILREEQWFDGTGKGVVREWVDYVAGEAEKLFGWESEGVEARGKTGLDRLGGLGRSWEEIFVYLLVGVLFAMVTVWWAAGAKRVWVNVGWGG